MLVACRACCRAWLKRSLLTGVPAGMGATPLEGSDLIKDRMIGKKEKKKRSGDLARRCSRGHVFKPKGKSLMSDIPLSINYTTAQFMVLRTIHAFLHLQSHLTSCCWSDSTAVRSASEGQSSCQLALCNRSGACRSTVAQRHWSYSC